MCLRRPAIRMGFLFDPIGAVDLDHARHLMPVIGPVIVGLGAEMSRAIRFTPSVRFHRSSPGDGRPSVWWLLILLALLLGPARSGLADPRGTVTVSDGDTWLVGKDKVRLFGIDAPEQDQTCRNPAGREWACGAWVTETVRARYQGRRAVCKSLDRDRYARIVARCRVDGRDVGRDLVHAGLAFAYAAYSGDYVDDEKRAMMAGIGLHRGTVERPEMFRKSRTAPSPSGRSDCAIKGNIGRDGRRIYHLPGQRDYDRTSIDEKRGERWFCSEADARGAGWRKARR